MAVEVTNPNFGKNGHAETVRKTLEAHRANTVSLLNLTDGADVDAPRDPYNGSHEDNQWPKMLHHATKGEKTVGVNLKGLPSLTLDDKKRRAAVIQQNETEYKRLQKEEGYQVAPFPTVHIAVLDAKTEKAELHRQNAELRGQILTQQQQLDGLAARLDQLAKVA